MSGRFRYAGMPEMLSEQETYRCRKYVTRHKAAFKVYNTFLIDCDALQRPFNLDCRHCKLAHGGTCCEGGQPYPVETWQVPYIEQAAKAAMHLTPAGESRGIWDRWMRAGTISQYEGNCRFFADLGGCHGCALHAFAEAQGQDLYLYKPFSCQLYPLDLIQMGEQLLITALTEETAAFSRWGTDYLETFYCASLSRRKERDDFPEDWFAPDGYRPAYEWGLSLLRRQYGEELETAVVEACTGNLSDRP